MRFIRMFSGDDGRTHFEDLDVEFPVSTDLWAFLDVVGVQGARLHVNAPNLDAGFHTEPRRQLVVYLTGSREMISGTGESRVIGPGDVLLAEDMTGEGHRTRSVSNPQQFVLMPLDPELGLDQIFGLPSRDPDAGRRRTAAPSCG